MANLPLRPPVHPGQSDTLVHFCGRGRPTIALQVEQLTASQRLDSILREGVLRAWPPYGATNWPVVSFSESDSGGVEAMLRIARWQPWGVVLDRDWVWRQGGGPVWYARDDEMDKVVPRLDDRTLSWVVRTEPQASDWLHEREWRIPCADPYSPEVQLDEDGVVAILVGDAAWEPGPVHDIDMSPISGDLERVERSPRMADVPRWLWTGANIEVLNPVPLRVEYHGSL